MPIGKHALCPFALQYSRDKEMSLQTNVHEQWRKLKMRRHSAIIYKTMEVCLKKKYFIVESNVRQTKVIYIGLPFKMSMYLQ
jgi:hypothetical protein